MSEENNPYQAPESEVNFPVEDVTYEPKIFTLSGRIGRTRYFAYSTVGLLILTVVAALTFGSILSPTMLAIPAAIGTPVLLIVFAVFMFYTYVWGRRRLNDLNKTGWMQAITMIPYVGILFYAYMLLAPGTPEANNWGPRASANTNAVKLFAFLPVALLVALVGILAAMEPSSDYDYVDEESFTDEAWSDDEYQESENNNDYVE